MMVDDVASVVSTSTASTESSHQSSDDADVFGVACCARRLSLVACCAGDTGLARGAWDVPLSAAEKRERVIALFLKDEALGHQQLHHAWQIAKRARRHSQPLRQSSKYRYQHRRQQAGRLRKCVGKLREEQRLLLSEVSSLRVQAAELREECERLAIEKKARPSANVHNAGFLSSHMSSATTKQTRNPAGLLGVVRPVGLRQMPAPSEQPAPVQWPAPETDQRSHRDHWSGEGGRTSLALPAPLSLVPLGFGFPPPPTPRSLASTMTPRGFPRSCAARGTVAVVSWSRASSVPWLAFTSRITGLEQTYGTSGEDDDVEQASLRRGEFVRAVTGTRACNRDLAGSLRILTSEGQEFFAGADAADTESSVDLTGQCEMLSFAFEAQQGFEIIGLRIHNSGHIEGVQQLRLAPARVSLAPGG